MGLPLVDTTVRYPEREEPAMYRPNARCRMCQQPAHWWIARSPRPLDEPPTAYYCRRCITRITPMRQGVIGQLTNAA